MIVSTLLSANREWTPMHANRGVNTLMASDSRLFAFIRGFRLNHHAALTCAWIHVAPSPNLNLGRPG